MQTKAGAKLAKETIVRKYGEGYWVKLGALGGSKTHAQGARPKGFAAMPREKRVAAGELGGARSRRRKSTVASVETKPNLVQTVLSKLKGRTT